MAAAGIAAAEPPMAAEADAALVAALAIASPMGSAPVTKTDGAYRYLQKNVTRPMI